MHLEFIVQPTTPHTLARSAQRALSLRPTAVGPVAAVVVGCAVLAGGLAHSAVQGALAGVGVAAAWAVMVGIRTERLGRALVGRGYAPGTTITTDWDDASVTVTTPGGQTRHSLADVAWMRQTDSATTFHLRRAHVAVVLPAELVASDVAARIAAARRSTGAAAAGQTVRAERRPSPPPVSSPNRSQADATWTYRD